MPFQLSPGVNVTEIDLTTVIPAVATTDAAIGGVFKWGPVGKPSLVVSEVELANEFGKPSNDNAETWFTAANFLAYSNRLHVSRAHVSEGDAGRLSVYAVNNADYLVVHDTADATTAGILDSHVLSDMTPGITDGQQFNIDSSTIEFNAGALSAIAEVGNNAFTGLSTALTILEGEAVTVTSDPSGDLPDGLSNTTTYYVMNVGNDLQSFELHTDLNGTVAVFTDQGSGNLVLEREGSTRITFTSGVYSGTTGSINVEFHDSDMSFNAVANNTTMASNTTMLAHVIKNEEHYESGTHSFDSSVLWAAKYPGELGNSLKVSVCTSADAFSANINLSNVTLDIPVGSNTGTVAGASNTVVEAFTANLTKGDVVKVGNTMVGIQYLEITEIGSPGAGNTANVSFTQNLTTSENIDMNAGDNLNRLWQYWDQVEAAPGTSDYVRLNGNTAAKDEMHVVVVDEDGDISGIPGTILEVWQGLSRATDAKGPDGEGIYYPEVINQSSKWIWWTNHDADAPAATALTIASSAEALPTTMSFRGGRDVGTESTATLGSILRAYDVFKSPEDIDISLVLGGKSRGLNDVTVSQYIIDNVCERRKDCVAFISPAYRDVVNNATDITEDVVNFRNNLSRSSSYAVMDSGYKYQYDKYNDVYRWLPLNGDVAGLCAYTDDSRDPWWSPAGFNRGNIKNVVKLAWNPKKGERDILYKNGVNPVVNFPGQGIVLFGDKTLLSKPSAFDRINVRRLFIVLEKAIATASKFTLFEFNDEFTRASFVNLVTPFLRDVQGRRGITDFAVVCDETNNTGEVIDRNEFVGDIYIKPARSINFIQLNFVAVRTGVEFSEVIGQF